MLYRYIGAKVYTILVHGPLGDGFVLIFMPSLNSGRTSSDIRSVLLEQSLDSLSVLESECVRGVWDKIGYVPMNSATSSRSPSPCKTIYQELRDSLTRCIKLLESKR